MNILMLISILITLCALFSYINVRFLKLQSSIGLMSLSLLFSLLIIAAGKINGTFHQEVADMVRSLNFSQSVLNIMLGFLLFAGSLHININDLKKHRAAIFSFSTFSLALSIFFFGSLMWCLFKLFNSPVDYAYCLWFGALVSPTDPIAVIGILKKSKLPKETGTVINGESLFNDGVGVVIFITIGQVIQTGTENFSTVNVLLLFAKEVLGGLALGLALGYGAYSLIRKIDHYQTEVLISLALVMICGEAAQWLHVSGPLSVIIIGLLLGNKVRRKAMSDITLDYYNKFWELLDDFLNAILFVLMGLQMVLLPFLANYILIGAAEIILLLFCRYISLYIPGLFLKDKKLFNTRSALVMTWGGLRGGLSVALTLSLPDNPYKELIVAVTYIIVIFSIIVQGLTTAALVKKLYD